MTNEHVSKQSCAFDIGLYMPSSLYKGLEGKLTYIACAMYTAIRTSAP